MQYRIKENRSDIILFSSYQFFHVGLFSFYIAFLPLYLSELGLNPNQIAFQSLISTLSMMVMGPLVLEISSHLVTPKKISIVLSFVSPFIFLLFLQIHNFYLITATWFLFMGTRIASGMLVDVDLLKRNFLGLIKFERVRLWGSVGFIVIGFILGLIVKNYGSKICAFFILPLLVIQNIINIFIANRLSTPDKPTVARSAIFEILKKRNVFILFTTVALSWISHAPLYTYLSLYLESLTFSPNQISLAWNIGVTAEIIIFICFSYFETYLSLISILKFSVFVASFRWLILFFSQNFIIIMASQVLHAFSFAAVLMCSTKLAYQYFPHAMKAKSQGYLSLLGIGMGSLIGRVILTIYPLPLNSYLEVKYLFLASAAVSALAFFCLLFLPNGSTIKYTTAPYQEN